MGDFLPYRLNPGDPVSKVTAEFYNKVDEVLTGLQVIGGSINKSGRQWTIVVSAPYSETIESFKVLTTSENQLRITPGRCYWWNTSAGSYDTQEIGGTVSAVAGDYILIKLSIDNAGAGTWSIEVESSDYSLNQNTQTVRYWCIAEIDSNANIKQRYTGDIYETRAG